MKLGTHQLFAVIMPLDYTVIRYPHGYDKNIGDGAVAQSVHDDGQDAGSAARGLATARASSFQKDFQELMLAKELFDVLEDTANKKVHNIITKYKTFYYKAQPLIRRIMFSPKHLTTRHGQ